MRQARGAEHQGDAEAQEVDLARGADAVLQPRLEERLPLAGVARSGAEQVGEVEVELGQHEYDDQRRAGHQQDGLDDLHPRGALHATDGDVEDHQDADREDGHVDRELAVDAEEQGHERAGADHLRQQVEDRDHDRRGGGSLPDRALLHPVGELVGHRVAAGVAEHLGDEQQCDQPGHEEADRVQEAVVAGERDRTGDAEERGRRHVVAADREAVLEAGEAAAAGVVVSGAGGLPARPEGDADRERDHREEEPGGQGLVAGRPAGSAARSCALTSATVLHVVVVELACQRVELGGREAAVVPGQQERGQRTAAARRRGRR